MNVRYTLFAACTALALAACGGSGSSEPGIEISLKALTQGTPHHDHGDGHDHDHATTVFRRADGMKIQLELGLLNLVPIELQRCGGLSAATVLDALNPVGRAIAHAGHSGEPPAGAVSALAADGGEFDLGTLTAEPGTYCGLIVELQPGSGVPAKHGAALDTDMSGTLVNVAPCFYDGSQGLSDAGAAAYTAHHCGQVKVGGIARRTTLPFASPVTLDAGRRELSVSVVTRYEEWFDGIDAATLASSAAEQSRLVDNVLASLYAVTGAEQNVALGFKLAVGGEQAVCGSVHEGLGNTAQPLRVEGFRFYASNFTLENTGGSVPVRLAPNANGTVLQTDAHGVALIGHAQGCASPAQLRALTLTGRAPRGDYDRVCFDLGVPFELNHANVATAPSPLNVTAMNWGWRSGRMFFRFDAKVAGTPATVHTAAAAPKHGGEDHDDGDHDGGGDAGGDHVGDHGDGHGGDGEGEGEGGHGAELTQNFFVHLGSTGCTNGTGEHDAPPDAACAYPNRPRICLDYPAIAEGHSIIADIAPAIRELDITVNTPGTAPGCMSGPGDPECATILPKFGLDFALAPDQLVPRQNQAVFSVGE